MAAHFVVLLKLGSPSSPEEIEEAADIVKSIKKFNCSTQKLKQIAVAWIGKNPTPIALGKVGYKR